MAAAAARFELPGPEEMEEAKAACRRVIESGDIDEAPKAADRLGDLLRMQGDIAGASSAYQQAMDSGHASAAPSAAVSLGILLRDKGDVAGAKAAYRRAIGSGHELASVAQQRLRALRRSGRPRKG